MNKIDDKNLDNALTFAWHHGSDIIIAVLIAVVGLTVITKLKRLLQNFLEKKARNSIVESLLINFVYGLLVVILLIIILNKIGVPTTSLLTMLGASGLAIALALQGSLSNIASGIILAFEKPFKIGDLVEFDGKVGTVEEINLFHTLLRSFNCEGIYIPNSKLTTSRVINKTYKKRRRIDLEVGISYDSDIKRAKQVIMDLLTSDPKVLKNPEVAVAVKRFDNSAIILLVRPWTLPKDYSKVMYEFLENVKYAFDEAGIEIPYPHMNVRIAK